MKIIAKNLMHKVIHSPFVQQIENYKEKKDLSRFNRPVIRINNLRRITKDYLNYIFTSNDNEHDWSSKAELIKSLELPENTGGVNKGDQRAIFYLVNHFKPTNVLEVGTHIACSTVHIAIALKKIANSHLTTVDIIDVNDPLKKDWLKFGSKHAPSELISMTGANNIRFVKDDSLTFFKNTKEKFDFIFLDGSHQAKIVYQEISLALNVLNKDGIILLHDYFPNNKPLWHNVAAKPGPYLAVEKLINQGIKINVIPLGELPWDTKKHSKVTSLAVLTANDR
jgi:predicted O-methyltransferase YrrM